MKRIRAYLCIVPVVIGICSSSGCATTSSLSYDQQMRLKEEQESWDQLSWAEKTGYYLAGLAQSFLYAMGQAGASFHP